mgnify:CR=1 FL=1
MAEVVGFGFRCLFCGDRFPSDVKHECEAKTRYFNKPGSDLQQARQAVIEAAREMVSADHWDAELRMEELAEAVQQLNSLEGK